MIGYKPQLRVGIDWDNDGYTHLDGVGESLPVSPVTNPVYPQAWSRGWNLYGEDTLTYNTINGETSGIFEAVALLNGGALKPHHVSMLQKSPFRIWDTFNPAPLFDGYSYTGVNKATPVGVNAGTTTTDPQATILLAGNTVSDYNSDLIVGEVDLTSDLSDTATSIVPTAGTGIANIYDNTNGTYFTHTTSTTINYTWSSSVALDVVEVKHGADTDKDIYQIEIEYYTGTSWSPVSTHEQSNVLSWSAGEVKKFTVYQQDTRRESTQWRLKLTHSGFGLEIDEISLYGALHHPEGNFLLQEFVLTESITPASVNVYIKGEADNDHTQRGKTSITIEDLSGTVLCEAFDQFESLPASLTLVNFTFDTTSLLNAGQTYYLKFKPVYTDFANTYLTVGVDTSGTSTGGRLIEGEVQFDGRVLYKIKGQDLIFSFTAPNTTSKWDGHTIFVADNIAAVGSGTTNQDTLQVVVGATDYTSSGTYSGIAVTAANTYVIQYWIKYTSDQDEACDYVSLQTEIAENATEYYDELVINPSWNTTIPVNTWLPVAIEYTATGSTNLAIRTTFRAEIHDVDGKLAIAGFMVIDGVARQHKYKPQWGTAADQSATYGTDYTTSASGYAFAQEELVSNVDNAVDNNTGTWYTSSPVAFPHWVGYNPSYSATYRVERLTITASTTPARAPFVWELWAGDSTYDMHVLGNYTVLYSGVEGAWSSAEKRTYDFDNPNYYNVYEIRVYSTRADRLEIAEFELIEKVYPSGYDLPSMWVSPYFYTKSKTYAATDFSNTLASGTTYKIGFWAKADAATDVDMVLRDYEHTTATHTEVTDTLSLTTSYQFFEYTGATTPTNTHSMGLYLGDATASNVTIYIKGVAIYTTSSKWYIAADNSAYYDNLNDYLLEVTWQLGSKKYFDEPLAYEGTAEITVNNDSQLFSPKNTASPLYGKLNQNLRINIQVKDPATGTWVTMWSGWTHEFDTRVGRSSDRRATIRCKQGFYRMRKGDFGWSPVLDARLSDIVPKLVEYSGWRTTVLPMQWWITNNTVLAVDTYLAPTDGIWSRLDAGETEYEYIGDEWNNKVQAEAALKDALNAEDAKLLVDRKGYLMLVSRTALQYFGESFTNINLDTYTKANYSYGENLINQVEVFINPKEELQDQLVWRTREYLHVPRKRRGKAGKSVNVLLTFEFEEGKPKSVDNIKTNQDDMDVAVYRTQRKRRRKSTGIALVETSADNVTISITENINGQYYLQATNDNKYDVYVDIGIYGDIITAGEGISYSYSDPDAIGLYNALYKKEIKNPLVTTELQAKALADLRLTRNALPDGEFTWFEIIAKDDARLSEILALTVMDKVAISETQVAETQKLHVILGEVGSYSNGVFTMKYETARLPAFTGMLFGDDFTASPVFGV